MHVERIEDSLHEAAAARVGFDDFGDPGYREGLRAFLEALESDLGLSEREVDSVARGPVLTALTGRLHSQRGWRETPGYRQVPIVAPVFIVGLPRSGTTALHQLLASDPRFQGIEHWLVKAPMVRPPLGTWETYPTYRQVAALSEELAAEFRTIHWMAPGEYDECIHVHAQDCLTNHFGSQASVPSYDAWFLTRDQLPAMRRLADNYRLVGARTSPERTWLLKNPSHLFNLDAILDTFPDARILITHRDPVATLPSVCNLLYAMRRRDGVTPNEPADIGRREVRMWAAAVERLAAARARRPESFVDVMHADLLHDPIGVVVSIYGRLGLELSENVEIRMRRWIEDVAPTRRGARRVAPEDFGLAAPAIADRFREYRATYRFA